MSEETSFVLQGSVTTTAVLFLQNAVMRMIPYSIAAIPLIILDLRYGIKAARMRGDKVRFSTALRRTVTKTFTYVCWLILASTIAVAFSQEWLEWIVLGAVFANEMLSIIGNLLETRGLEISWKNIITAGFHLSGQKVGVDTNGIDPMSFVHPVEKKAERPRGKNGRFVKK